MSNPNLLWLHELDLKCMSSGWGEPVAGRSIIDRPLTIHGQVFDRGVGTHAPSDMAIDLDGCCEWFEAIVGVDDEVPAGQGSVVFEIWADGAKIAQSPLLRGGNAPHPMKVNLRGVRRVSLVVSEWTDGSHHDHADWAEARFTMAAGATAGPRPVPLPPPPPNPPIIFATPPTPAIHGPRIVGATPGRPFLFMIPATGEKPLEFSASGLPAGVALDPKTGIISGAIRDAGTSTATIVVSNRFGEARRELRLVAGPNKLALTPPMGWNSWNCWATAVDAEKVRDAARAMVTSGLAAYGYSYVNIDDAWEADRGADGLIRPNDKFPDMRKLADDVHAMGLKLGIYSSPGPKTCGGYTGSYQFERQDAQSYAQWGIDFLKHDWCSYGHIAKDKSLEELQKPYLVMRDALAGCGRDIVYSLCQYGMGNVWEWGTQVGANLWRTTGDITDTWGSMAGIGFSGHGRGRFAGPGHWNDPDMLVVGHVGWGPRLHPTKLTGVEQITHIGLWALQAAPLLVGCDLSRLDDFTLAVLTNTEVLDVDQDPLGRAADRVAMSGSLEVWARPLFDGSMAVGLFNRGREKAKVVAPWEALGLSGERKVRDLWLREDLGTFDKEFAAEIEPHASMLVKL